MKFKFDRGIDPFDPSIIIIVDVHPESFLLCITVKKGLERANTGYPQPEIDYDLSHSMHRPKVIGVDII